MYAKSLKKILIIFVLFISPFLLNAQFEDEFDDDEFGDVGDSDVVFNVGQESLSDMMFNTILGPVLNDTVSFKIKLFGTRRLYDLFGDPIMTGINFMVLNHSVFNDMAVDIYGGRSRKELNKDIRKMDVKNINIVAAGVQFEVNDYTHSILGGEFIPVAFTPYTLQRLKIFGFRWDMEKEETLHLKSFWSTRFKEEPRAVHDAGRLVEEEDRLFYAFSGHLNIGTLSEALPEILDGQYIGVNWVYQKMRNGLNSDSGAEGKYLHWDFISSGDILIENEQLLSFDLNGTLYNTEYYVEYITDKRKEHKVKSSVKLVGTNFITYPDTDITEYNDEKVFIFSLKSDNMLKEFIKGPALLGSFNNWYISGNYGADWAVDDDDDNDMMLDETLDDQEPFMPYEASDVGFDEPSSGVINAKYNENENRIPDYEEDFLLFNSDRHFLGSMVFEDANYNGIIDYEENDLDPDFPFDRNRQGWNGYIGITPWKIGTLLIGGSANKILLLKTDNDPSVITNNSSQSYFFGFQVNEKFFKILNVFAEYLNEKVEDRIKDDFIGYKSFNDYQLFTDDLGYRDNQLHKFMFKTDFIKYEKMTMSIKLRKTFNHRFDDQRNEYSRNIFKLGYDYSLELEEDNWVYEILNKFTFTPQFKYEKAFNKFITAENKERVVSENDVMLLHMYNFDQRTSIFKIQYDINSFMYFITGVQYRDLTDYYFLRSYKKKSFAAQIMIKQDQGKGYSKVAKSKVAFTVGYKQINQDYYQLDDQQKEETMFAKLMVLF